MMVAFDFSGQETSGVSLDLVTVYMTQMEDCYS